MNCIKTSDHLLFDDSTKGLLAANPNLIILEEIDKIRKDNGK